MISEILTSGEDLMVHASFSTIRDFGSFLSPAAFCEALTGEADRDQSLSMPAFTYSFVNRVRATIPFNRDSSPSVTGVLSETFRNLPDVIRTLSPSHSFSFWGEGKGIEVSNNPVSPLGRGSVCDILFRRGKFGVALIGCGFESFTLLHYFENQCTLPYITTNSWSYMGVEPVTLSVNGAYPVIELPGCSKGFRKFEDHLIERNLLNSLSTKFKFYLIDSGKLLQHFREFTAEDPLALLCDQGCPACDCRREIESQKIIIRRN